MKSKYYRTDQWSLNCYTNRACLYYIEDFRAFRLNFFSSEMYIFNGM